VEAISAERSAVEGISAEFPAVGAGEIWLGVKAGIHGRPRRGEWTDIFPIAPARVDGKFFTRGFARGSGQNQGESRPTCSSNLFACTILRSHSERCHDFSRAGVNHLTGWWVNKTIV
jgi:hypothetical protein